MLEILTLNIYLIISNIQIVSKSLTKTILNNNAISLKVRIKIHSSKRMISNSRRVIRNSKRMISNSKRMISNSRRVIRNSKRMIRNNIK